MGKREAKNTNRLILDERTRGNRQFQDFNDDVAGRLPGARDRGNQAWEGAMGGYRDILSGGGRDHFGADPEVRRRILGSGDELRGWGRNSISAGDQARMRGGGVFDEFARTGGQSEQDVQNLRNRGAGATTSIFSGIRENLENQGRTQGGYNPGYTGQMSKLARDQGRAAIDNTRDTELGITDARNRGRQWGAEGMATSENALQSQLANNFLQAFGLAGNQDLDLSRQEQAGRQYGANRELQAAEGMRGLYGTAPGEEGQLLQTLLAGIGGQGGGNRANIGQYAAYNPNVSTWDRVMQIGGMAANGAASAYAPGAGGGGGKRSGTPQLQSSYKNYGAF